MIDFDKFAHPPEKLKQEFSSPYAFFGLLLIVSFLLLIYIIPLDGFSGFFARKAVEQPSFAASIENVPLIKNQPVVALNSKHICSLLGQNQRNVGVIGEDVGKSVFLGSKSYYDFGDVQMDYDGNGTVDETIANAVGVSTDFEGSDCIDMTMKTDGRFAVPYLEKLPTEHTVWSNFTTSAKIVPGTFDFFYDSHGFCQPGGPCGAFPYDFTYQGAGLARFDPTTLEATRVDVNGNLVRNQATDCNPVSNCMIITTDDWNAWGERYGITEIIPNGNELYLLFTDRKSAWLGKVPANVLWDPSQYRYWNGKTWVSDILASELLWTQPPTFGAEYDAMNGFMMQYNQFLGKWMAIYSNGFSAQVSARVAPDLKGPWSDQYRLIHCSPFLPGNFPCYLGRAHSELEKNNGQTIYVTYTNSQQYKVHMSDLVLGSPVYQWEDELGHTAYRIEGQAAPSGFSQKGLAFYASSYAGSNFAAVHEWLDQDSGNRIYSPSTPNRRYVNNGIVFYAPVTPTAGFARIHRWDGGNGRQVYSSLDLSSLGFGDAGVTFYAKITEYIFEDPNKFLPIVGDSYEITVTGGDMTGIKLSASSFSGLESGKYAILACTFQDPPCGGFDQDLIANESGEIFGVGEFDFIGGIILRVSQDSRLTAESVILTGLEFKGLSANTQYQIRICCEQDLNPIVYLVTADNEGKVGVGDFAKDTSVMVEPISPVFGNEGEIIQFQIVATDPNATILVASSLPTGASFNTSTNTFSWTPNASQAGSYRIDFNFTLADGSESSETVVLYISNVNQPPVIDQIEISPQPVNLGQTVTVRPTAQDPNGDSITFSINPLPSGANFSPVTGIFEWTPANNQAGSHQFTYTVTDERGLSASQTINITVKTTNRPPELNFIGNKQIDEGETLDFKLSATDLDGDQLFYDIGIRLFMPDGACFNGKLKSGLPGPCDQGQFIWTPGYDQAGAYPLIFVVSDGEGLTGLSDTEAITIIVNDVVNTPRLIILDPDVNNTGNVEAADIHKLILQFGKNTSNRGNNWPLYQQYDLNGDGAVSATDIGILITHFGINSWPNPNQPQGIINLNEGREVDFYIKATDPENDDLSYSLIVRDERGQEISTPKGLSFTEVIWDYGQKVANFIWETDSQTLTEGNSKTFYLEFSVSDGTYSDSQTLPVRVNNLQ